MRHLEATVLNDMHTELKEQYRRFFESKFAADLSKEKNYFSSVGKISEAILQLITKNQAAVLNTIRLNMASEKPDIKKELQKPFYGHCFQAEDSPTPEVILATIIDVLANKESALSTIMQIHCIFAYRIYKHLTISAEKQAEKKSLTATVRPDSFFSESSRDRTLRDAEPTTALGFVQHPVFAKMVGYDHTEHLRAVDQKPLSEESSFFKEAKVEKMPVVCGASGHTGSLLAGAKLYGELSSIELSEYAIACFVFMAAGGNHSFHEVMCIANLISIPYQPGNYAHCMPASIQETKAYTALSERFPEFLSQNFGL